MDGQDAEIVLDGERLHRSGRGGDMHLQAQELLWPFRSDVGSQQRKPERAKSVTKPPDREALPETLKVAARAERSRIRQLARRPSE